MVRKMGKQAANQYLSDYNERLEAAEAMLPLIGKLWRNNGVPTYVFGVPLHLKTPIEILKAHRSARHLARRELSAIETHDVIKIVAEMNLSPARIDVGKLLVRFQESGGSHLV